MIGRTDGVAPNPDSMLVCENGNWINMVDPNAAEITYLQRELGIPPLFIEHALDIDELARVEKEGQTTLIVLRIAAFQGQTVAIPYTTIPLGIILTEHQIITICKWPNDILPELMTSMDAESILKSERIVLQILLSAAEKYLGYLREINAAVDTLEDRLQHSLRNKEVLELLRYQKSLTYFNTALKLNEMMLERLQQGQLLQNHPEDEDLVADVLIEIRQAIIMTGIASDILSQMMDAFASIISNNLNLVMKFLTAFTIVLTFPTMVASFYGMNVGLPGQSSPYAFAITLAISLGISLIVALVFWRKDWL
jgi:magnesium transporter